MRAFLVLAALAGCGDSDARTRHLKVTIQAGGVCHRVESTVDRWDTTIALIAVECAVPEHAGEPGGWIFPFPGWPIPAERP